jgi:hypothetical protein
VEAHPGAVWAYQGAKEGYLHPVAKEIYLEAIEAQTGIMKALPGAIELNVEQ